MFSSRLVEFQVSVAFGLRESAMKKKGKTGRPGSPPMRPYSRRSSRKRRRTMRRDEKAHIEGERSEIRL
jgi:hypothetical protein